MHFSFPEDLPLADPGAGTGRTAIAAGFRGRVVRGLSFPESMREMMKDFSLLLDIIEINMVSKRR